MRKLQHGMNCDALAHPLDGDCACGLTYRERIAELETELTRLQAENARLKEPVSRGEMRVFGWILSDVVKARFDLLIAARATAPAGAEPVDSSGKTQCSATMGSRRCSSAIGHNGVHFYQSDEMRYFTGGPGVWRPAGTEVGEPDQ